MEGEGTLLQSCLEGAGCEVSVVTLVVWGT